MIIKVVIDAKQRTIGGPKQLWNRLTPTRGSKNVSSQLATLCQDNHVRVVVGKDVLSFIQPSSPNLASEFSYRVHPDHHRTPTTGSNSIALANSQYYARCLYQAGVTEVEIPQGTSAKNIKASLDTLSDIKLKKIEAGFQVETKEMNLARTSSDPDELAALAKSADPLVRVEVAKNPNTTEIVLENLRVKDQNPNVRQATEENPMIMELIAEAKTTTSETRLLMLDQSPYLHIRIEVAKNPSTPSYALTVLSQETNLEIIKGVAGNANTRDNILIKLAEHKDFGIKIAVAKNSNCPFTALEKLIEFHSERIVVITELISAILKQLNDPSLSEETLSLLSKKYPKLIQNVPKVKKIIDLAGNPDSPAATLRRISTNPIWLVQAALVANPNIDEYVLRVFVMTNIALLKTQDVYIAFAILRAAASNPNCPPDILEQLAKGLSVSMFWQTLAENPSCPVTVVAQLVKDFLPHSIPKEEYQAATEGRMETTYRSQGGFYDYLEEDVYVPGTPEITGHPAAYAKDDFQQAADIINQHPQEKRRFILSALERLDPSLSRSIQLYVEL